MISRLSLATFFCVNHVDVRMKASMSQRGIESVQMKRIQNDSLTTLDLDNDVQKAINKVNRSFRTSLTLYRKLKSLYADYVAGECEEEAVADLACELLEISRTMYHTYMMVADKDTYPAWLWKLVAHRKHLQYDIIQPIFQTQLFPEFAIAEVIFYRNHPRRHYFNFLTGLPALESFDPGNTDILKVLSARRVDNFRLLTGCRVLIFVGTGLCAGFYGLKKAAEKEMFEDYIQLTPTLETWNRGIIRSRYECIITNRNSNDCISCPEEFARSCKHSLVPWKERLSVCKYTT